MRRRLHELARRGAPALAGRQSQAKPPQGSHKGSWGVMVRHQSTSPQGVRKVSEGYPEGIRRVSGGVKGAATAVRRGLGWDGGGGRAGLAAALFILLVSWHPHTLAIELQDDGVVD
jgi:hypothetical protein